MSVSPSAYGLLGLLATRSWTGYELTRQIRRSLRFIWSTSDGHLYREQKRLVELGWATVEAEPAGRRTRQRYTITDEGRAALREWLEREPQEPHFQLEGVLQMFFANYTTPEHLASSMRRSADLAASMRAELLGFVADYLATGGPMELIEQGVGGPGQERVSLGGRPLFPERLHVVALALEVMSNLLGELEMFAAGAAQDVAMWPTTDDKSLAAQTRTRLERILAEDRRRARRRHTSRARRVGNPS
jgi:DNA-binding PadR family transcriptional regulator